jgi:hypothetical protein
MKCNHRQRGTQCKNHEPAIHRTLLFTGATPAGSSGNTLDFIRLTPEIAASPGAAGAHQKMREAPPNHFCPLPFDFLLLFLTVSPLPSSNPYLAT